jgi:GNAT superfamily N-acetyltransferase
MTNQPFHFRQMQSADIAAGLALCRAARWNQTRHDWEFFLRYNGEGCRVAECNSRVIGTVTTVHYQNRFSWIGMVLVDPDERGRGIGTALMREALDVLREQETVKLDATPAGRGVYLPLGFVDEYHLARMEGVVPPLIALETAARLMTPDDLEAVCEMDAAVFGAERRALLAWWFEGAREYAWVVWERDALAGFCLGRHGHHFEQLGPVIARDAVIARQLVTACWQAHARCSFVIDVPTQHTTWSHWLAALGFHEQRPFTRMTRGVNRFAGLPERQFAILGPEFG